MHGQTYKVQHSQAPRGESPKNVKEYVGLSSQMQGLCWVTNNKLIADDAQEQTFYHELVHLILNHLNEKKLNKDEKFVDGFAGLLHQYLKTRKY